MKGDHPARLHVTQVDGEGFLRDEVHRDRIAGERIHRQHIESLRCFALQREAREIPLQPNEVGHVLSDLPDALDSKPPFVVMVKLPELLAVPVPTTELPL